MNIPGHDPGAETGPRQATPFTRTWYWAFLAVGIAIFIGGITPWEPEAAIADLPGPEVYNLYGWGIDWGSLIQIFIGVFIAVGAILCLIGAQYRTRLDESWRYERTGALVGITGWVAFVLAVGAVKPSSLVDLMFPLFCGVSLLVRWITLGTRSRIVRFAYRVKLKDQETMQ